MKSLRFVLLLLVPLLTFSGCTIYNEDADARLHWVFPGNLSCFEAGVVAVEVQINGLDRHDNRFASLPCEAGSVEFRDLDKGHYEVLVLAFGPRDPEPLWIFDNVLPSRIFGGFNEFTLILEPF